MTRERSGRSGRRLGSQKPGIATGLAAGASELCWLGPARGAAAPSTIVSPNAAARTTRPGLRNGLLARLFHRYDRSLRTGVTRASRSFLGASWPLIDETSGRISVVCRSGGRGGVSGWGRSGHRPRRRDDWAAATAAPSIVPELPRDRHDAPPARHRAGPSQTPPLPRNRLRPPPAAARRARAGRAARRREPAWAPTAS